MAPTRLRNIRVVAVLSVLAALFAAHRFGLLRDFADPARLKQTLLALGPWGYLVFLAAYAILQPFLVPGTVFVVAASLVWPWPIAFALSVVGTMAASSIGFAFARFVARDWAASKVPARFKKYDEAIERHAFKTVVVLRFVFWMPQWLHAFFGVSRVRFWTHFWGSLAGYAVPLLLISLYGERLFVWLEAAPAEAWVATGVAVGVIAVSIWALRSRAAARAARE